MLVRNIHGMDYSTSVAVVRLANIAALGEERNSGRMKRFRLSICWNASPLLTLRRFPHLPSIEVEDESSGEPGSQRGRNTRS